MYYLMIKTHNKTGLKYLCQTRRKDPFKYVGSGKYWKLHLLKHGTDIHTEIIGRYDNNLELTLDGIKYSDLYNVVESNEWANLRIEDGRGGDTSKTIGYLTGMEKRRSYKGSDNPNYGKVGAWTGKVGPMLNKSWYTDGAEEALLESKPDGWYEGRLQIMCQHCGKLSNNLNHKNWHGDKCKKNLLL